MSHSHFFRQFLRDPRSIGSLAPSSPYLGRAMTRGIDFSGLETIIEYGSGTGTVTREILTQKEDSTSLYAYEIDESFRSHLETIDGENFFPQIQGIETITDDFEQHSVDVIFSCLPLGAFSPEFVEQILSDATQILKKGGYFIQFQYFLQNKKDIEKYFTIEKVSWELRNIPPAGIYRARNNLD